MEKEKYIELLEVENKRLELELNQSNRYKELFEAAQKKHGLCSIQSCLELNCRWDHK